LSYIVQKWLCVVIIEIMQTVKFNPISQLVYDTVPLPKPTRDSMPEWYKKAPSFQTKTPQIDENGKANKALKLCQPFMDAMSSGYVQESWQDIDIQKTFLEDGQIQIKYVYTEEPEIMSYREQPSVPIGEEFYPIEFTFHPVWIPELPEGWSMLYMTPLNRVDLPFQFMSGIVDSDSFTQSEERSNIPFYIKKSFSGVIPKGTPLVQMIPVRRENWKAVANEYNAELQNEAIQTVRQHPWGGYRKHHWTKKNYK
jgi:hypothetical protein